MISEQAQKKRDELALDHYVSFQKVDEENQLKGFVVIEKRFGSFCYGFDQGYQFAKSEAAEEIEKLKDVAYRWQMAGLDLSNKIKTLEAIIQKLEDGLRFYSKSHLYQCKDDDSLMTKDNGEYARIKLAEVQAMKEGTQDARHYRG